LARSRFTFASAARSTALWLALALLVHATPAAAQPLANGPNMGGAFNFLADLIAQMGNKARTQTFSFLRTVELYDVEGEIDRLVGNPWQLSDSTSYKLGMFPVHIAYPVYQQLVSQMTRLDELRSLRIQNLTPESMNIINVRLDILNDDKRSSRQLLDSATHFLNGREVMDLGIYGLAQTPAFPGDDAAWQLRKHQIALHKGAVALLALSTGAVFDAGAYGLSGRLARWSGQDYQLGWYGSFSRLGFGLHPYLRGGMTMQMPGLELAGGWAEQVQPGAGQMRSALEISARESWFDKLTAATGWDSFVQGAFRRVLDTEPGYEGERMTGRAGIFTRRQRPLFRSQVILRTSLEGESDFAESVRFAASVGLDHTRSGISVVAQSSRNLIIQDGLRTHDIRTALFLAGTLEPPTRYYIHAMIARARLVREQWETWRALEQERAAAEAKLRIVPGPSAKTAALQALGKLSVETENAQLRLIDVLADYLEARKRAYALKNWVRNPNDEHGPLDEAVLRQIRDLLVRRLNELLNYLQLAPANLQASADRIARLREDWEQPAPAAERERTQANLESAEREWRQASDEVARALQLFTSYRASARRIVESAPKLTDLPDGMSPSLQRKLTLLCAQSLED
jgi:hypothetical protein